MCEYSTSLFTVISLVMWYLLQNTEATALTAKHQTYFALRQFDCKQHGEHWTARYPVIVSFWETIYSSYNICSNSHFLPGVLSPVCANSIFNCEHIELANCSSAMLQLVNSTHRKPRAQSPSIGIIMQRTLPIMLRDFQTWLIMQVMITRGAACQFISELPVCPAFTVYTSQAAKQDN